jgi:capsular polysaccharide biosynthesis protein
VNQPESSHSNGHGPAKLRTLSADEVRERLWAYEDFATANEHQPYNVTGSFASLGFIWAAIKRSRRFWLVWAVIGIVAGLGIYVKYPVSYVATVSVLVKNNPGQDPISAMQTQVQLAQSETVAANTVKELGLPQSVSSFRAAYTATSTTSQIITITLHAPTADGAVQRANALAAQYLKFRANMLLAQQAQDVAAYAQQVPDAEQHIASLQNQISQLQGQAGQQAQVTKLQSQLKTASEQLPTIEQTVTGLTTEEKSTTSSMIDGTQVLDAATVGHHSKIKDIIEYALSGLIGGLAIGIGIVVVRELTTDRLRRRDDIAAALGAPIRLSVGSMRKRRLPIGGTSGADRDRALGRFAAYLRNAALRQADEPATLAVVAVDNAREIAPAIVALTERCAQEGFKIVVADLVNGAPVARRLGADGTGVQPVRLGGGSVVVITPEDAYQVPSGPLRPAGGAGAGPLAEPPTEAVESVAKKARILVTVAELDPAIGAEHLSTWASQAVAVFTVGRTRATRAYAVGEMLRLSGIRAVSGVIAGADKTDETLGSLGDDSAVLAGFRSPEPASSNGSHADDKAADGGEPGASHP